MKPESHALVGLVIGAALGQHDTALGFATTVIGALGGSILPDIPIALQVKEDDRLGRVRFALEKDPRFEYSGWFLLKEISHSPLIWMVGFVFLLLPWPPIMHDFLLAGTLGVLSHWMIDLFTHCGAEFRRTDQSLWWPLYLPFLPSLRYIPKLGYAMGRLGLGWEYRYDYRANPANLDKTKAVERACQIVLLIVLIILIVHRFL